MHRKLIAIAFFAAASAAAAYYFACMHNVLRIEGNGLVSPRLLPQNGEENVRYTHRFAVRNMGLGRIRLEKPVSSCGCTGVEAPSDIGAFGRAEILAHTEIPSSLLQGKRVEIFIRNSSKTPDIVLKCDTFLGNYYFFEPQTLDLGAVHEFSDMPSGAFHIGVTAGENTVPRLEAESGGAVRCETEWDGSPKRLSWPGEAASTSVFHRARVKVLPLAPNGVGKYESSVSCDLYGDSRYVFSVPVRWEIVPFAYFRENKYIFSADMKSLPVVLLHDFPRNGEPSVTVAPGDAFRISRSKKIGSGGEYLVEYIGPENSGALGEISAEFPNGKTASSRLVYGQMN